MCCRNLLTIRFPNHKLQDSLLPEPDGRLPAGRPPLILPLFYLQQKSQPALYQYYALCNKSAFHALLKMQDPARPFR